MGEVQIARRRGYRSLFWPLLLIGIGSVWLLVNIGIFNAENIAVLVRLWPLLLIAAGLDLLFGRNSPTLGAIIGVGAIVGMLLLMLIGPSMGLVSRQALQSAQYEELIGDARSAEIVLGSGVNTVSVRALSESRNLFAADIRYYGEIDFDVSNGSEKTITLKQRDGSLSGGFAAFLTSIFGADQPDEEQGTDWNIQLSRDVPVNLNVDAGVGSTNLDLRGLELTGLAVNAGVGKLDVTLPVTEQGYFVNIDGGVGDISITLPEGIAVQLDAEIGVGSVSLPSSLRRIDGDSNNVVGADGIWETDGFRTATTQVTIKFDGGVGSLTVH